jgi:hypothetical protein
LGITNGGGISLNFELDYQLLNQKMAEFLDKHNDEIITIMGQCLRFIPPDPGVRLHEIKGSIMAEIPEEPFKGLFNDKQRQQQE